MLSASPSSITAVARPCVPPKRTFPSIREIRFRKASNFVRNLAVRSRRAAVVQISSGERSFGQRQTGIRGHLMILLLVSAIAGGVATSALFWAKGGLAALALAPIGGSLAAGMAAAWLGMKAGRVAEQTMDLDEQIATLRAVAAHGRALIEQDARRAAADAQAGSERAA
jgi:hypothetical protein